jgi:hypothetical protein
MCLELVEGARATRLDPDQHSRNGGTGLPAEGAFEALATEFRIATVTRRPAG